MAPQTNLQIILSERPTANIIPGKTFTQRREPIPKEEDLKDGEVLLETLYVSLEPAMRGWIQETRSYVEPVPLNTIMRSFALSRVAASRSPAAKPGDLVTGLTGWQEWAVASKGGFYPQPTLPEGCRPTDLLGALGATGMTAYFGVLRIGEPKKGDTVVVSAAAGATGSIAGQIAKIQGARVIGIAGGADKCRWLKEELGFDVALDYKADDLWKKFKEATPDYVDVYFDNVGGEILDMVLKRAKAFSRFVMCGAISQYNKPREERYGVRAMENVVMQRIKMQGFIVSDFASEFAGARKELAQWVSEGKIRRRETIIKGGLEKAEGALVELYKGANTGKMLVEVRSPEEAAKL